MQHLSYPIKKKAPNLFSQMASNANFITIKIKIFAGYKCLCCRFGGKFFAAGKRGVKKKIRNNIFRIHMTIT